jgi:GABA permease
MRLPVKSETDAFRITYGFALLIGLCVLVGAILSPAVGIALFAGGCLGAIGWDMAVEDPDRVQSLREASRAARRRGGGATRILVISNETLVGRELRQELLRRGEPRPRLRVVAPVLPSRSHYLTSDIDDELGDARHRLEATLAWAREQGFVATGRVGDDTPPMTAIEDELRRFAADELLISTHPPGRSNWLETGLVERAREELDITVTHVVVDLLNQRVEILPSDPELAARQAVGYSR